MPDPAKAKGGFARAKALTAVQRRQISQKGGLSRWGSLPKATHKGTFKDDFGIDVDCYVLGDPAKTGVISKTGLAQAVGLSARSNALSRFLETGILADFGGSELHDKIKNPLRFQWLVGDAKSLKTEIHGYDVTLLIDVCKAIILAHNGNHLTPRHKPIVQQAHVILTASAKSGIQNLVYKLAGYDAPKNEIISAFKLYVREEAKEYEREFPEELYDEWYRLYELPRPDRNHPWKFKHLTMSQVYEPLAKSNGKILCLVQGNRHVSSTPKGRLHQFLSEVGGKALRVHLGKLTGIANISRTKEEYERYFNKLFGVQLELFDSFQSELTQRAALSEVGVVG